MLEQHLGIDLASVLHRKAMRAMAEDLGDGPVPAELYNGVLKDMKMRHYVRTIDAEGIATLHTAEEVIAAQRAGTWDSSQAMNLWIPTDDVLRSMVGELGNQGVDRVFLGDTIEIDPAKVPTWKGITPELLDRLPGMTGDSVAIENTRLRYRNSMTQMRTSPRVDPAEMSRFDMKMRVFAEQASQVHIDRRELRHGEEVIHLTDREREMLTVLAENSGETVPRLALAGTGAAANERAVDVQINRLRRKIERDPANPLMIQTVRGIGYRLMTLP